MSSLEGKTNTVVRLVVGMPTYNGANTILQTMDSILRQSYNEFKLIVCDDASTDSTYEIVSQIRDERIILIRNHTNLGLGPTMNRLLAACLEGVEYFAVAEQDDVYVQSRLADQVAYLDDNPEIGMVSGIAAFCGDNGRETHFPGILVGGGQYPQNNREMFLLNYREQIKVVNTCMMLRLSIHRNNGLYFTMHYPSIPVDWAYVLRFSTVSRIAGLNKVLVYMDRTSGRNSVTKDISRRFKADRELLRSFRYEYQQLVTDADYSYAMLTQELIELGHLTRWQAIVRFALLLVRYPFNARILSYAHYRIRKMAFMSRSAG